MIDRRTMLKGIAAAVVPAAVAAAPKDNPKNLPVIKFNELAVANIAEIMDGLPFIIKDRRCRRERRAWLPKEHLRVDCHHHEGPTKIFWGEVMVLEVLVLDYKGDLPDYQQHRACFFIDPVKESAVHPIRKYSANYSRSISNFKVIKEQP